MHHGQNPLKYAPFLYHRHRGQKLVEPLQYFSQAISGFRWYHYKEDKDEVAARVFEMKADGYPKGAIEVFATYKKRDAGPTFLSVVPSWRYATLLYAF